MENEADQNNETTEEKDPMRTISSYCPIYNNNLNNLLNFMTHESKNIYNTSIYFMQIYLSCKNFIFKELYELVDNDKITNIKKFDRKFYKIFEKYYQKYLRIREFKIHNNRVIYKFIKQNLKNLKNGYLINSNYHIFEKFIITSLLAQNILRFPKDCTKDEENEVFYKIVGNILRSIYTKNFNLTKEEILSKKACTIQNEEFIEQVKNGQYLLEDIWMTNYKQKLKSHELFKKLSKKKGIKSDQNYMARIIYIHYKDRKIPSDVMCNIIPKAYQALKSFFALRKKGIKANMPKFLPKNGHYVLPFLKRSFKEVTFKNNKEIRTKHRKKKKSKRRNKKIKLRNNIYYRLTIGKTIASDYVKIIDDDRYLCLNPNDKTNYKKYIEKKHTYLIQSGEK